MTNKSDKASVCHVCRRSSEAIPVAFVCLANGEVHLSVQDGDYDHSETLEVSDTVPALLAKSDVALILDLRHRVYDLEDPEAGELLRFIEDVLPTMVARALTTQQAFAA